MISVYVDDPNLSEALQKVAFEHGYSWKDGNKDVMFTNRKYLLFNHDFKQITTNYYDNIKTNYALPTNWYSVKAYLSSFKMGEWTYAEDEQGRPIFRRWNGGETLTEGFSPTTGRWTKGMGWKNTPTRKATHGELTTLFTKEASRLGYTEGVTVMNISPPEPIKICDLTYTTDYEYKDGMIYVNGTVVYEDGQWAKIMSESPKFDGHTTQYFDNKIRIGCQTFNRQYLLAVCEDLGYLEEDITIGELQSELKKVLNYETNK